MNTQDNYVRSDTTEPKFSSSKMQSSFLCINKRKYLLIGLAVLILMFVLPYAKVEILTINAEKKLETLDMSYFENIYEEGIPEVYDCKIFKYSNKKSAKVFYVFGECEYGVMTELEWNDAENCWEIVDERCMWTVYGGSAQEFYWPLYYPDKLFPLVKRQ